MLEFEFQNIKSLIGKQITSEPTRIDDLPDKIGKDQKKIGRVTRWLLDNCYLEEGHDGTLSLNPDKPLTEC